MASSRLITGGALIDLINPRCPILRPFSHRPANFILIPFCLSSCSRRWIVPCAISLSFCLSKRKRQYLIIFAPNLFKQELYLSTNQEHNHNNLFICIDRTDELESKLKHFFYEIANEIPLLRKTTLLAVFCKHVYN